MNAESKAHRPASQMSLFGASTVDDRPAPAAMQRAEISPHLLAARRLSRQIRRLPDHSPQGTATGLAICRALKAYLEDQADRTH